MSSNKQCSAAPFEQSLAGRQLGRRAPNQPRPTMMRPRATATRHRAAHGRHGLCDASAHIAKAPHKLEDECADNFVTEVLQEAVDDEVSCSFVEMDYESESGEEFAEDYDEVMSLSNSDEESQEDVEAQAFQYIAAAANFAKNVVHQGIQRDLSTWPEEDSDAEHDSDAENEIEELRLEARNFLLAAPRQGRFEAALEESDAEQGSDAENVIEDLRLEARSCTLAASRDGRFEATLEESKERAELEQLRQEAKACLTVAAKDGRLEAALKESKQHAELQDLRQDAREALLAAAKDGRLLAALKESHEDVELKELRHRARNCLAAAAKDGRLAASLKASKERRELEELRQEARRSLIAAAQDGSLEAALKESSERSALEQLRREARASLTAAAYDGRLEAALREAKEYSELNELRQAARASLVAASKDGRLEAALKEARKCSEDKLRGEVTASFAAASVAGLLEAAVLKSSKERAELDELRQEAVSCLRSAAQDGRLEAAFKECIESSECERTIDAGPQEHGEVGGIARKTSLSMPLAEKLEQLERPVSAGSSAKTPGRTKRRVIGGVVRCSSAAELPLQSAMASPSKMHSSASEAAFQKPRTMAGSPASSLRRRQKEPSSPSTFHLDEDSGCEGRSFSRKTSFTSMFDALGPTEVFSLDGDEALKPVQLFSMQTSPRRGPGMAKSTSASAISAKSAMAMDLGSSSSSAMCQDLGVTDELTRLRTPSMGSRCSSLGSLTGIKDSKFGGKQASLLPMISKPKNSASGWFVDHSVSMSKNRASRGWGTMGSPVL